MAQPPVASAAAPAATAAEHVTLLLLLEGAVSAYLLLALELLEQLEVELIKDLLLEGSLGAGADEGGDILIRDVCPQGGVFTYR